MQVIVNLLKEWEMIKATNMVKLAFPIPKEATGWYPIGFERGSDSAFDAMGWYGLELEVNVMHPETSIDIKAHFADKRYISSKIDIVGTGRHRLTISLSDFGIEEANKNIWRFLEAFEINGGIELVSAVLKRGKSLYLDAKIRGRAGVVNEQVCYDFTVYNCSDKQLSVVGNQVFKGWESLIAKITPEKFVLESGAGQKVQVVVGMHAYMVPGGHENTIIRFIPNGNSESATEVVLKTLYKLEHPYIYHNEAGWHHRRKLLKQYPEKLKPEYDKIIADADKWVVRPPVPVNERDYCYDTKEEHYIMSAAYAYAFTKEQKYAEKIAQFFKYFTDPEIGYPRKKKGCSQSYVQEGHFFQHLAIPYDIIYNSGVLTKQDHQRIENTFRIYMDILDFHLQSGHISNWLLSEITGAVYCALAISDIERVLRFVFGPGGTIEQLRYGLFNDGWWYECSVSYNTWVASMLLHTAHALLPFGYNIFHTHFPIAYNDEVSSSYKDVKIDVRHGMYNKKWGGNTKNYVCIKELFDAPLKFVDYRGVMFGVNDSTERKLEGVHFGSTYDLAYTYYQDSEYIPVINRQSTCDPIFGHPKLPTYESQYVKDNAYSDNIGVVMLRSQTKDREEREQIQAVLRYGSHGYAHGHFDRTQLLSLMRYGRSFYNPEHVWWGYGHFMYKFYVQNSITKNMVVVDEKMQVPADARRILFYSGKHLQAAGVETKSRWAYPPYGGMVYNEGETLEQRCQLNASSLPSVKNPPTYGELSDYTEEIEQKRIMAITDDYVVLFDYLQGEKPHQFDSLLQIKGFLDLQSDEKVAYKGHTSQLSTNPLSDAQFVTDCKWHTVSGNSTAKFATIFGENEDMRGTRSEHNCPGILNIDVHTAWPQQSQQIIGRAAEDHGVAIPLEYKVEVDGLVKAEGEFGAWLLGEGKCDVDISGANSIQLRVKNNPIYTEQGYPRKTKQALFWGEAYIITRDGSRINLSQLNPRYHNIDVGHGIGKDYEGGRVTIVGNEYPDAIPTSPINHDLEGVISIDLSQIDGIRFVGLIGADAFPGDESQRRMTYSVRTNGNVARFATVIEPYEGESMLLSVQGVNANTVKVKLKDGRQQIVTVEYIETQNPIVRMETYKGDKLLYQESSVISK